MSTIHSNVHAIAIQLVTYKTIVQTLKTAVLDKYLLSSFQSWSFTVLEATRREVTGTRVGISSPKKSEKIRGKIGFYILNYRWLFKTSGESVLSSTNRMNLTNLAPCTHEEADT